MKRTEPTILALDPGLRELGWAALKGRRLLTCGTASFRRHPRERRLLEVKRQIRGWTKAHRPQVIVVERTYRHPVPWLDGLDGITRYARGLARRRRLGFVTYAPQQVRKTVLGNGKGTKREVAAVVAARFPALRVYLTQDRKWKELFWLNMFDAVALALHHQTLRNPPSRSRCCG
jgi:Holliday junction resolvasome RuvABC endonuclease subunit